MTQDEVLNILKTGANVFLTGEPGSGKTHTVNQYVSYLRACGIDPAITASTGIAATHIGGFTIHSWSGVGVRSALSSRDLDFICQNERIVKRVERAKVLIIDEVSMLSANVLSMVDKVCRVIRRSPEAFGGLQVILVGDFFQLPPVSRRNNTEGGAKNLWGEEEGENMENKFAYESPSWHALNPLVCYLSEQHRQEDKEFLGVLSAMRSGVLESSHLALLSSRQRTANTEERTETTRLFTHNADVDRLNNTELQKIKGIEKKFTMEGHGVPLLVEQLKKSCLSPETLLLKIGAKVMFTKNDFEGKYVNGTIGEVVGFAKEDDLPIVKTESGKTITADMAEWAVESEGKILARILQVPLRLAWAITVHKSQGMSLDSAVVDLSGAFEYGQGYVAISRVRTLSGLRLIGLNARALEVHPAVRERDERLREESEHARQAFRAIDPKELHAMQENFVRACGGKMGKIKKEGRRKENKELRKESRWEETLRLIREGKSIAEVAAFRSRKQETILEHLEGAKKYGKLSAEDITLLLHGKEKAIADIHAVFKTVGTEFLKPAYEHFGKKYSYNEIRLARVLWEE